MERNICHTCPAKKWNPETSTYVCDPAVFKSAKRHPNGGVRLRPTNCPENAEQTTDKAAQILRQLLRK